MSVMAIAESVAMLIVGIVRALIGEAHVFVAICIFLTYSSIAVAESLRVQTDANVRAKPSGSSTILGVLPAGTEVIEEPSRSHGAWVAIRLGGRIGYVYRQLFRVGDSERKTNSASSDITIECKVSATRWDTLGFGQKQNPEHGSGIITISPRLRRFYIFPSSISGDVIGRIGKMVGEVHVNDESFVLGEAEFYQGDDGCTMLNNIISISRIDGSFKWHFKGECPMNSPSYGTEREWVKGFCQKIATMPIPKIF